MKNVKLETWKLSTIKGKTSEKYKLYSHFNSSSSFSLFPIFFLNFGIPIDNSFNGCCKLYLISHCWYERWESHMINNHYHTVFHRWFNDAGLAKLLIAVVICMQFRCGSSFESFMLHKCHLAEMWNFKSQKKSH